MAVHPTEVYEALAELVRYEPSTGKIYWAPRPPGRPGSAWNARNAGRECGIVNNQSYRTVLFRFRGRLLCVSIHRLVWFFENGSLPRGEIDHIDGVRTNNHISNLRDVSPGVNQRNARRRSDNVSGVTGVSWAAHVNKWQANTNVAGKRHYLGLYDSFEDACQARLEFQQTHGFTERHGSTK